MKPLKRDLNELQIWSLALGAIIGWGCFVLPGNKFLPTAGPLGTAIGLLAGGLMMMVIARSYGVLINRFPVAGGEFTYAFAGFGRGHAFICAWLLGLSYLSIVPLNATALGLISRFMFPGIIQVGYLYSVAGWDVYLGEVVVSTLALALFGYLNIRGVRLFGKIQNVLALGLTLAVVVLSVVALVSPVASFANLQPMFSPTVSVWPGILSIVAIAPWAFVGFDAIPQAAEEFSFSPKKTFRIMVFAILVGAFLYIAVNTITAMVFPWTDFLATKPVWATGAAIQALAGDVGMVLLGTAILFAIISGINGFMLASSRLLLAMARAKALPQAFGKIHPVHQTPYVSIAFVAVISMLAPWFGREVLLWIVDMAASGAAIGYFYTCASSVVLSFKNADDVELRKNRFYGILGSLFSLGFLILLLVPGMPAFLSVYSWIALIVWIVLGVVFYGSSREYRHMAQSELEVLLEELVEE
jgi:amino acid transporter